MLKQLLLAALSLLPFGAMAVTSELDAGKVYRFTNASYTGRSLAANSTGGVYANETNSLATQLWYVAEKSESTPYTYKLRNWGYDQYLTSNGSSAWKMSDSGTAFYIIEKDSHVVVSTTQTVGWNSMHSSSSQGYVICGWDGSITPSQWDITLVQEPTEAEVTAHFQEISDFQSAVSNKATYQGYLNAIFTDKACTTMSSTYSSMTQSALEADAKYTGLPTELKAMVLKHWKVANGTTVDEAWAEDNYDGNDEHKWGGNYAKRYRIQKYEPYSTRDNNPDALKINNHAELNNPTGIFANSYQNLYIMVSDDAIPSGGSLYFGSEKGNSSAGSYKSGVELEAGLNIIPYYDDLNWTLVYYNVNSLANFSSSDVSSNTKGGNCVVSLASFPDLTIQIAGGNVNGYYNAVGDDLYTKNHSSYDNDGTTFDSYPMSMYKYGDRKEDWDYLAKRNNLEDLTILGKWITFQFYFNETNGSNGTNYYFTSSDGTTRVSNIEQIIQLWDRVVLSERITLGIANKDDVAEANNLYKNLQGNPVTSTDNTDEYIQDYSNYYRQHCLAIGRTDGYMSGGGYTSNYNVNTFGALLRDWLTNAGNTWGPGHEIGHQHQMGFTYNGLTEVTNNLFANVAVWYDGRCTSRTNGGQGSLENVNNAAATEGGNWWTNNIWAQTHMYYKLWMYYHLCGNNTKFYPRLFEMLRRDPIDRRYDQSETSPNVTGKTPLLHFYRKCCEAAGEDLTEFFRAYGFFEVMDHQFVGDYSNSVYTQTQAQIDAQIAAVKAQNLPVNNSILFINDADLTATYTASHSTNTNNQLGMWDGSPSTAYEGSGSYTSFVNGTTASSDYALSFSGTTATVTSGSGAVGVAIYDAEGHILSFGTKSSFALSTAALEALANGTAVIKAVNSDGTFSDDITYDATALSNNLLAVYIGQVEEGLKYMDDGGTDGAHFTKVGFYKKSEATDVLAVLAEAKQVVELNQTDLYSSKYDELKAAYQAFLEKPYTTVEYVEGATVALLNKNYANRYLTDGADNIVPVTSADAIPDAAEWIMEDAGDGTIYLKNKSTSKYVGAVTRSSVVPHSDTGVSFTKKQCDVRSFAFAYSNDGEKSLHCDQNNRVVGWDYDGVNPSQWHLVMIDIPETAQAQTDLQTLMNQTKALLATCSTFQARGWNLDTSTYSATANSTDSSDGGHPVSHMFDSDTSTFYHSAWKSGEAISDYHSIVLDMGDGNTLGKFQLWYLTRNNSSNTDAPSAITVQGSNDNSNWTDITTLDSGLPTAAATEYASDFLGSDDSKYRYIRLQVTNSTAGTNNNYHYFAIAELRLRSATADGGAALSDYATTLASFDLSDMATVYDAAQDLLDNSSATTAELTAGYTALKAKYDALYALLNPTDDLTAMRAALRTALEELDAEIAGCGYAKVDLAGKIYCNAPYTAGGTTHADYSSAANNYNLLDGSADTYFHSDYSSSATSDNHYVRANMSDNPSKVFRFRYTTRKHNNGRPKTILVTGCDTEDGTYETITTLTGLPTGQGVEYTTVIEAEKAYNYLRFEVTSTYSDSHYFCMSEFGIDANVDGATPYASEAGSVTVSELAGYTTTSDSNWVIELDSSKTLAELTSAKNTVDIALASIRAKRTGTIDTSALQAMINQTTDMIEAANELGDVSSDLITAASNAKTEAEAALALGDSLTEETYTSASTALNTALTNLSAVVTPKVTELLTNAKTALTTEIEAVGTAVTGNRDLVLTGNLYANAPQGGQDNQNQSGDYNLLDNNVNTIFHSAYQSTEGVDDPADDHYIRAYVGTVGLGKFKFSHQNRPLEDSGGHIKTMVVEGARAENGPYYEIATLTGLPQGASGIYTSEALNTDGILYNYIRFRPTETRGTAAGRSESKFNGHLWFCMAELDMTQVVPDTTATYMDPNKAGAVTEAELTAANTKLTACTDASTLMAKITAARAASAYATELTAKRAKIGDRSPLTSLIEATTALRTLAADNSLVGTDTLATYLTAINDANTANVDGMTVADFNTHYSAVYEAYQLLKVRKAQLIARKRTELQAAIDANQFILDEFGNNGTEHPVKLQTSMADSYGYLYCNAPYQAQSNGDYTTADNCYNLTDGNTSTYCHTDYSNNAPSEAHYLQVYCGEEGIGKFQFNYSTRASIATQPTSITVAGFNDPSETPTEIATLSSELPTASNNVESYTSETLNTDGNTYKYIRFTVNSTNTNTAKNGYPYFCMSEFGVTAITDATEVFPNTYSVTADNLTTHSGKISDAQTVADNADATLEQLNAQLTAMADLKTDMVDVQTPVLTALKTTATTLYNTVKDVESVATEAAALNTAIEGAESPENVHAAYGTLLKAYNALNAACTATTDDLTAAINKLQAKVTMMADDVATTGPTTVGLQSVRENQFGYLYCNAPYTALQNADYSVAGTDGYHLLDGNTSTYLHTSYAGSLNEDHYIRVYGGQKGIGKFSFSYTNRAHQATQPTTIVVEGSNEADGTYTTIATLTKDDAENALPTPSSDASSYTSAVLGSDETPYRYIRFRVTATSGNVKTANHVYFCMSEFGMTVPQATVGANKWGVSPQLYDASVAALTAANTAVNKTDVTPAELFACLTKVNDCYDTFLADQNQVIDDLQADLTADITEANNSSTSSLNPVASSYISSAQTVLDNSATQQTNEEFDDAYTALTNSISTLEPELAYAALPVKLCDNDPIQYYLVLINRTWNSTDWLIESKHTDSAETHKVKVANRAAGADTQLWYFMRGETAPNVKVYNKASGKLMSVGIYNNTSDLAEGAGKIAMLASDANNIFSNEWYLTQQNTSNVTITTTTSSSTDSTASAQSDEESTDETTTTTTITRTWYNIHSAANGTYLVSNYGGQNNNLGFYNSATDGGSQFNFEAKSAKWIELNSLVAESSSGSAAYTKAVADLTSRLTVDDTTLQADIDALKEANKTLRIVDINALTEDDVIYDFQGRRIMHPTRGFYIINGRKVYLK